MVPSGNILGRNLIEWANNFHQNKDKFKSGEEFVITELSLLIDLEKINPEEMNTIYLDCLQSINHSKDHNPDADEIIIEKLNPFKEYLISKDYLIDKNFPIEKIASLMLLGNIFAQ